MNTIDARRNKIVEYVNNKGSVGVDELCKQLNVSEMTVRRDLNILDRQGLLKRIHGGATANLGRCYEPPLFLRSMANVESKKKIGAAAADYVYNGSSVILDSGTTVASIIPNLLGKHNLTIVTSSLMIANEVLKTFVVGSDLRLIVSGGIVRQGEISLIGPYAQATYDVMYVDVAFLGIGGLHPENGLTEFNLDDTQVKKHIIRCAKKRIALADSHKIGVTAMNQVAPIEALDMIITDKNANPEILEYFRDKGIKIIIT
jgi:DeoR/GlpR family transcriptional regulator of sugar metabolism